MPSGFNGLRSLPSRCFHRNPSVTQVMLARAKDGRHPIPVEPRPRVPPEHSRGNKRDHRRRGPQGRVAPRAPTGPACLPSCLPPRPPRASCEAPACARAPLPGSSARSRFLFWLSAAHLLEPALATPPLLHTAMPHGGTCDTGPLIHLRVPTFPQAACSLQAGHVPNPRHPQHPRKSWCSTNTSPWKKHCPGGVGDVDLVPVLTA